MHIKIFLPFAAIALLAPTLVFANVTEPEPPEATHYIGPPIAEVAEPLPIAVDRITDPQAIPESHFGLFVAGWFVALFVVLVLLYQKISPKTPTKKVFYWALGLCLTIFLATLAGSLSNKLYVSGQIGNEKPPLYQNSGLWYLI